MLDNIGFYRRLIIDESLYKAGDELKNIVEICSDETLDDASVREAEKMKNIASDALIKIKTLRKELEFNFFDEVD